MTTQRKMTEVADPNAGKVEKLFAKFDKFGDYVEGHFVKVEQVKGKFGDQNCYNLIDETGALLGVYGSADIDAKMGLVGTGIFVRVEFVSERPNRDPNKSAMKVFKVSTCLEDRLSDKQIAEKYAALEAAAKAAASGNAPF